MDVSKSLKDSSEALPTPELLMKAAKSVFARRGYDGATVKEIADTAGVNISLVSYYFQGKEGLYRSCLERFGGERLAVSERVLTPPESLEDFRVRLQLFAEEFVEAHVQEPEVTLILHRECVSDMPVTKDLFRNVFIKIFENLVKFFKSAQKADILRDDLDLHIATTLFMGSLVHSIRIDPIQQELFDKSLAQTGFRKKVVQLAVRQFIEGAQAQGGRP